MSLNAVVLTPRRLTQGEAVIVHEELKSTPNILGYSVRELLGLKDVVVAEVDGSFAGLAVSVDLLFRWTEIAFLLVVGDRRGLGIGRRLFEYAWDRAMLRRRHIYMLSRNAQVIEWMRGKGMRVDRMLWRAPFAVQIYMPIYMSSWYRHSEAFRKYPEIRKCPRIVQGIKKSTPDH